MQQFAAPQQEQHKMKHFLLSTAFYIYLYNIIQSCMSKCIVSNIHCIGAGGGGACIA